MAVTFTVTEGESRYDREVVPYPSYHFFAEQAGEVVNVEMVGSYQGDYVFALRKGRKVGILIQGFGSCSYCDAVEGMIDDARDDGDTTNLNAYAAQVEASVLWGVNAIRSKDWAGSWYLYNSEMVEALNKTFVVLSEFAPGLRGFQVERDTDED